MNKNNIFAKSSTLYFFACIALIFAAITIYVCIFDEFFHSILLIFLYLYLFASIFITAKSYQEGRKELFKMGTTFLITTCLIFHTMGLVDMINQNYYYFFSGNFIITCIGIIAIILYISFLIAFINHFAINTTNSSNTEKVLANTGILAGIAILSFIQAGLVAYKDSLSNRLIEYSLICTYLMFFAISMILICVENLINTFRIAREEGNLNKVLVDKLDKTAAKRAIKNEPKKTKNEKTNQISNIKSNKTSEKNKKTNNKVSNILNK